MTITEIFALEGASAKITELKKIDTSLPAIDTFNAQWDPLKHDIFDTTLRPDKPIKEETELPDGTVTSQTARFEKVARIAIALQKLIVGRRVAFMFGNPVNVKADAETDKQKEVLKAVKRILTDNKINSTNRKLARALFRSTEVAEYWYAVKDESKKEHHGITTPFKMKVAVFSPALGDVLYPLFDEYGDLIAFSREYTRIEQSKEITYFDTWTSDRSARFKKTSGDWEELAISTEPVAKEYTLGKIPIIYARQDQVEWADVQILIDRLEKLLSNFADTNDYHAAPKIFVRGHITGFSKKGESGAIIEGDENSEATYLSWQNAPESVKLEIETLLQLIYTITQTPDISFESIKGIGAVSGIALKLMFTDAHLAVEDKMEIFDEYLQRRLNLLKAFVSKLDTKLAAEAETLEISAEVTPYMIDDETALMNWLSIANGGKPVISHRTSIEQAGIAKDTDAEFEAIQKETKEIQTTNLFEPTV